MLTMRMRSAARMISRRKLPSEIRRARVTYVGTRTPIALPIIAGWSALIFGCMSRQLVVVCLPFPIYTTESRVYWESVLMDHP